MSADISKIRREMEDYIESHLPDIEQLPEESVIRELADIVEDRCPGHGVAVIADICKRFGGSPVYLPTHKRLINRVKYRWIVSCGYSKDVVRQVTGYCSNHLNRIGWQEEERQLKLPGMKNHEKTKTC